MLNVAVTEYFVLRWSSEMFCKQKSMMDAQNMFSSVYIRARTYAHRKKTTRSSHECAHIRQTMCTTQCIQLTWTLASWRCRPTPASTPKMCDLRALFGLCTRIHLFVCVVALNYIYLPACVYKWIELSKHLSTICHTERRTRGIHSHPQGAVQSLLLQIARVAGFSAHHAGLENAFCFRGFILNNISFLFCFMISPFLLQFLLSRVFCFYGLRRWCSWLVNPFTLATNQSRPCLQLSLINQSKLIVISITLSIKSLHT